MKSTRQSRRLRNPRQKDVVKEQPFFSKAKEANEPFFGPNHVSQSNGGIQTKLVIGQPGDKYEQEADAVANNVVSRDSSKPKVENQTSDSIQRITLATPQEDEKLGTAESRMEKDKLIQEKAEESTAQASLEEEQPVQKMEEEEPVQKMEEEEPVQKMEEEEPVQKMEEEEQAIQKMEEEEPVQKIEEEELAVQKMEEEEQAVQKMDEEEQPLQAKDKPKASKASQTQISKKLKQASGKGAPLTDHVRTDMEQAFGVDFSAVRIHDNAQAAAMCEDLGAQAFTNGQNIYFNTGKFNPESAQGKKLLAHELTHVVQQSK